MRYSVPRVLTTRVRVPALLRSYVSADGFADPLFESYHATAALPAVVASLAESGATEVRAAHGVFP
jgi:hypothetical protein